MNLKAPPFPDIVISFDEEATLRLNDKERQSFLESWPAAWPTYRQTLKELFSSYDYENLLEGKQTRLLVEKLKPNKKMNYSADLLLRFAFDDSGITWDIFQKGHVLVHAQPAF